jgi:hypothetical protein
MSKTIMHGQCAGIHISAAFSFLIDEKDDGAISGRYLLRNSEE